MPARVRAPPAASARRARRRRRQPRSARARPAGTRPARAAGTATRCRRRRGRAWSGRRRGTAGRRSAASLAELQPGEPVEQDERAGAGGERDQHPGQHRMPAEHVAERADEERIEREEGGSARRPHVAVLRDLHVPVAVPAGPHVDHRSRGRAAGAGPSGSAAGSGATRTGGASRPRAPRGRACSRRRPRAPGVPCVDRPPRGRDHSPVPRASLHSCRGPRRACPRCGGLAERLVAARADQLAARARLAELTAAAQGNGHGLDGELLVAVRGGGRACRGGALAESLAALEEIGVVVKDIDAGLIDFPSLREGEEVLSLLAGR